MGRFEQALERRCDPCNEIHRWTRRASPSALARLETETVSLLARRCFGAATGMILDRLVGEPPTVIHPVAWFGRSMTAFENVIWVDRRAPGVAYTALGVGVGAITGRIVNSVSLVVAVTVAGRELRSIATQIGNVARSGDLVAARAMLPSLVGRDPSELGENDIAAAVIESVAENTVDAVIAPVFWGVVAGAPGAAAYRAINTMDAMVGHLNDRYRNFGWSSARLDDVANYLPARLFAALVAFQKPRSAPLVLSSVGTHAPAHPSPNAGVAETAVAASLGRRLGGPLRYGDVEEDRPFLGEGPRPTPRDITDAVALVERVERTMIGLLIAVGTIDWLRTRR